MTLLRASLITGVATVVRMVAGLLINKMLAVYVGPGGLAQIAQLTTLAGIANNVASGGVNAGVTRYVAEHGDARRSAPIVVTALAIVIVSGCASSLFLIAFSAEIALQVFASASYSWAIWIVAAANIVVALNALAIAVLNGRKRVIPITVIGISGSLLSVVASVWLIVSYGMPGAIAAACLAPAFPAVAVVAYYLERHNRSVVTIARPTRQSLVLLARYSAMTLTAAISGPVAVLLVRDHLAEQLSWQAAGYWQGVWKISEVYVTVVTSSLAVYFLPRLAELHEAEEIRQELRVALLTVVPLVAAMALLIYVLREWITVTLFSKAFLPMTKLFAFQLVGDTLKIASWVIAYLMIAKAMVLPYILTEVIFSVSFVVLSALLVSQVGLAGVTYAYCANYFAYLIAVAIIVRRRIA